MAARRHLIRLTLLLQAVTLSNGQTIQVGDQTLAATSANVAPAGVPVNRTSNATAAYFPFETIQLTDASVANLTSLSLTNASLFSFAALSELKPTPAGSCRVFPGDAAWPSPEAWAALGLAVGSGGLIKTVPIGASCYKNGPGTYDAARCQELVERWSDSFLHMEDPASSMWPLYQGKTCMPDVNATTADEGKGRNCTLGGFPSYVVDATDVSRIQLAVNFARNANLRLVVRNTGHDFNGRSLGEGALAIWTHKLKDVRFFSNLTEGAYTGPAMKLGAGVQAFELYEAADKYNVTAVGGEGKTVGVMGGYIAGGGHSPLSTILGMAADQVLSMEAVTADGRFVTASEVVNPDLFWALRGGGGSTFGVVTSVVVKVYPKIPVTTMTFSFATSPTVSADSFWAAVRSYFNNFILYTDFGIYSYFQIFPTSPGNFIFVMQPFFAPNLTAPEVESLTKPWISEMAAVGVDVSPNITQYDNYHDAWNDGFPLEAVGGSAAKTASRLFPRANWEDPELLNKTFSVIRDVIAVNGSGLIAFNIAANPWDNKKLASKLPPQASPTQPENAVNPAWRKTVLHAISMISWQENATVTEANARGKTLSLDWMQAWRDVSPGAGAYASEGDVTEPDFRQAFYGDKYSRLLTIKNKYDPSGLFYAVTGVGSEDWEVQGALDGIPFQMGRLCKRTVT